MEGIAKSYLAKGDTAAAAKLLSSLEVTQPRVAKLARSCRVLAEPSDVPVPHRFADIAEALLDSSIPIEGYLGPLDSVDETLRRFNRLLLLVHPDKNPYARAADAFVRLKSLKEEALLAVESKKQLASSKQRDEAEYEKLMSTMPPEIIKSAPRKGSGPSTAHERSAVKAKSSIKMQRVNSSSACEPLPNIVKGVRKENSLGRTTTRSSEAMASRPLLSPCTSGIPTVSPHEPNAVQSSFVSELQVYKTKPIKLKCVFQTQQSVVEEKQSSSVIADDDDEVLNCTVTSSCDGRDLRSSSFLLQQSSDGVIQDAVALEGLRSAFANTALAETRAVWSKYRAGKDV